MEDQNSNIDITIMEAIFQVMLASMILNAFLPVDRPYRQSVLDHTSTVPAPTSSLGQPKEIHMPQTVTLQPSLANLESPQVSLDTRIQNLLGSFDKLVFSAIIAGNLSKDDFDQSVVQAPDDCLFELR